MALEKKTGASKPAQKLLRFLRERGKRLGPTLILTHDHPDPDGMASAWALAHLIKSICRVRTRIAYGGHLGRRENLLMLENLLIPAIPIRNVTRKFESMAVVDTQPPFKNNKIDQRRRPEILIDHHPRHSRTSADCIIIDESVGATTTLLAEALLEADIQVPRRLATAMVYGIGSETQNLGREAGPRDVAAYLAFLPKANMKALWRISNPPRPASFFQMLSTGIRNAFVYRRVIGAHLRELPTPDRVGQMADFLLTHEKMRWCVVTGRFNGRLHVSLRTHSPTDHAGRLLRGILGGRSRGGGHRLIAGGSISIGPDTSEEKWRELEDRVVSAFFKSRGMKNGGALTYPFRNASE